MEERDKGRAIWIPEREALRLQDEKRATLWLASHARWRAVLRARPRALRIRPKKLELPPVYGDGSFRAAVREVVRGLLDGAIDEKTAGKLLYGLQMERGNQ